MFPGQGAPAPANKPSEAGAQATGGGSGGGNSTKDGATAGTKLDGSKNGGSGVVIVKVVG